MNSLFRLKALGIRERLFAGFSILVIPILIVILLFILQINKIEAFTERLTSVILPTQTLTSSLDAQIYATQITGYEWLLTDDPEAKTDFKQKWAEIRSSISKMEAISPLWTNKMFLAQWKALNDLYAKLLPIQNKIMAVTSTTNSADTKQLINEQKTIINRMITLIDGNLASDQGEEGMFNTHRKILAEGAQSIINDLATLHLMTYVLLALTIALTTAVSFGTAKKIIDPIKIYSKHSANVARGDLTQRLEIFREDEMGQLGNDLNAMTEGLATITKKITEASQTMSSTLDEVKQAASMQSTGVAEQASSINEITASLEEIDKSASQTMEKARILGQVAEKTSQKGQMGLDALEQSIDGMKSIREKVQTIAKAILELSNQTQQVGEITAVVNTLALQSKMLALNASIEAAKAGDAGKGFAVVAAEVKNLAEQSEQATTQVQKILEDIRHGTEKAVIVTEEGTKGVDHGTGLVEQMGEIVRSLSEAINETMIASQQIEAAVRQESLGIEQITVGMNEINQVTSSFVNTVKQTTESIDKLGEIAKNIKTYVDLYKA